MKDIYHYGYDRLFSNELLGKCYSNPDPINRQKPFDTAISAYIKTIGTLANLVINVFEVQTDNNEKAVKVLEIPVCRDGLHFVQVYQAVQETIKKYPTAAWLIRGSGSCFNRIAVLLTDENIPFQPLHWSGQCFAHDDRYQYANKRSMAYARLRHAVINGKIKIDLDSHEVRALDEFKRIGVKLDPAGKFRVSPAEVSGKVRLADTCAFPFMKTIIDETHEKLWAISLI